MGTMICRFPLVDPTSPRKKSTPERARGCLCRASKEARPDRLSRLGKVGRQGSWCRGCWVRVTLTIQAERQAYREGERSLPAAASRYDVPSWCQVRRALRPGNPSCRLKGSQRRIISWRAVCFSQRFMRHTSPPGGF